MQPCAWPDPTRENRPWTRWWWMGSAVDEANLTRELTELREAGFGGVEITPIYGVQGAEDRDVPFLSDRWLELVLHACREAERLGLGVDIVPGCGWRLGGPHVPPRDRAVKLELREQTVAGRTRRIAVACPSGEPVKRPAPGGAGFSIDMLDRPAVRRHLSSFNERFFAAVPTRLVRAQFHDSWEYETDWSRRLPQEFARRRGYDLQEYAEALDPQSDALPADTAARVLHDYRQTVDELVREGFVGTWSSFCRKHRVQTRSQAHGSPGNILDLYAASDIPETEMIWDGFNPLVQKFASSAAHVAGRRLVAAESFTWLSNHWQSDLAKIKRYADHLFLCGVNHIVCHGTAYSPGDAPWPGWLFYASTQLNARNPIWRDWPTLAAYITRCQSFLQAGRPDDRVLVYWPLPDQAMTREERLPHYGIRSDAWMYGEPLGTTARSLWDAGVLFDYVSDRQIQQAEARDGMAVTPGNAYRAVVLPPMRYVPSETVQALARLAGKGIRVVCQEDPDGWDVPGLADLARRRRALRCAARALRGAEGFVRCAAPAAALAAIAGAAESLQVGTGLRCVRRRLGNGNSLYFVVNGENETFDAHVRLAYASPSQHAILRDPWTGCVGTARITMRGLRLQLEPRQSVLVEVTTEATTRTAWQYRDRKPMRRIAVEGPWHVSFVAGGPTRPRPVLRRTLVPITEFGNPALRSFAGTIRYEARFDAPAGAVEGCCLELGDIHGSARICVNGHDLGVVVQPPYRADVPAGVLRLRANTLAVEVTTLASNRIRDLDRRGLPWKIFHDINFVDDRYKPFDASDWPLEPFGLLGPVRIGFTPAATR